MNFKGKCTKLTAKEIIAEVDKDKDGKISFEEFWDVFGKLEKKSAEEID